MHVVVSDKKSWTPEWNENKKLPADEQIVIAYDAMTVPIRKRVIQKNEVQFSYDRDGNPLGGTGKIDLDEEAPVRAVRNLVITNLEYDKGGKPFSIRTADDLLGAPHQFYGLIKEFAEHLRDEAKEDVPEKN